MVLLVVATWNGEDHKEDIFHEVVDEETIDRPSPIPVQKRNRNSRDRSQAISIPLRRTSLPNVGIC